MGTLGVAAQVGREGGQRLLLWVVGCGCGRGRVRVSFVMSMLYSAVFVCGEMFTARVGIGQFGPRRAS